MAMARAPERRRKAALGLAALVLAALGAFARPASAQVLVQVVPNQLTLTAGPGERAERSVMVSNLGATAVAVRARLSDWTLGEEGDLGLAPLGSTPGTLLGAATLEHTELRLAPGASAAIRVRGDLGAGERATRWGMLLCEVRPLGRAAAGASADTPVAGPAAELGATIFLTRLGPEAVHAEIVGLAVTPLGGDSVEVTARVRNAGERQLNASGDAAVRDTAGARLAGGALESGLVLPGMTRSFSWWGRVPHRSGPFVVSATLDAGEPELIAGELRVPWPLARPLARGAAAEAAR